MERYALNELRKNWKIVMKPADKGSATVILSREKYIREAHWQLNNKNPVNFHKSAEYQIQTDLNCDSVNVVYLITCNLSKKQYVGQTQNHLQIRTVCHKYDIRHEVDTRVLKHFNLLGHSLEEFFFNNPNWTTPDSWFPNWSLKTWTTGFLDC